ncbi:ATP-binding protein [Nocardia sp. NPDC006044]|uniref:ATP-binding protein n=1 Tax=Nocardia sp. NPDC006044 TaxID=3364306 RepID=UPI0036C47FDC
MTTTPSTGRRHGITEQAADAAVDQACRLLRLPSIRTQFSAIADTATREQMSYQAFLAELLMTECDDRARRRSERRIRAAGFPRDKSLRAFDFDANPKLVNELVEAADDNVLAKTIARYGRADLLCIDELGYMELDRRGTELLFQVLTEREEKNSVTIASNDSYSGWTKTFTDPRLCAAIVDRLTFGGHIIETGTDSYRLAHTRANKG